MSCRLRRWVVFFGFLVLISISMIVEGIKQASNDDITEQERGGGGIMIAGGIILVVPFFLLSLGFFGSIFY